MNTAAISLGSNINPLLHLKNAWESLEKLFDNPSISSIYKTKPLNFMDQDPYLNCVVIGQYPKCAKSLLTECLNIENKNNRTRSDQKHLSRTLDLDILLFNDEIINTPQLIIPHPGLCERDFMLIPLLELRPDIIHPETKKRLYDYEGKLTTHHILQKWDTLFRANAL